jgi:hypothetical protein
MYIIISELQVSNPYLNLVLEENRLASISDNLVPH